MHNARVHPTRGEIPNMHRSLLLSLTLGASLALLLAAAAHADRKTADACAAKLSPEAKLVYSATIGAVTTQATLKDTVTSKTRSLVMGGKLSRSAARPAAEAAGACLKQAL
jgi:hypothetical protein